MHKTLAKIAWKVGALLFMALWMPTVASAQSPAPVQASRPMAGTLRFKLPDENQFPSVDPPPSPRPPYPDTDPPPKPMPKAFDYLKITPGAVERMLIDPKKYPIVDPPPKPLKFFLEESPGHLTKRPLIIPTTR